MRITKREKLAKNIVLKILEHIQQGSITLQDGKYHYQFGHNREKHTTIKILHPRAYIKILFAGSVGAGKSYMDGDWTCDDLQQLLAILLHNTQVFNKIETPIARFISKLRTISYKLNFNTIKRAKDNILAHYDLGNEFFNLLLDPTMMYSCALFEPAHISLEAASLQKLRRICQKLELKPGDHVLEIGTGWAGFAIYAAQEYGCKITTTTISDKQYAFAQAKIQQLGLQGQIELLNVDYRQLSKQYDKIVSIEMIEAVGHKYFDTFFHQCNSLLRSGGLFFLQAIVINDKAYEAAKNEVDFIKKYIFPGGCLPSVCAIANSIATQTTMQLLSFEDIGKHYVTTLNFWQQNLMANKALILEQGFSEQFIRLWQFYFCYSAAGFDSHYISDIHALWRKNG